ncbi:ATP-grasp domain-containing protein [Kordiimonas aestuarii]|uniref:hypothetical protein n=1 Tax=Kordiimonas aestuarii TaxID=1005925 RepID=UPI0021D1BDD1|nr:hypothetical protein [Kordiimonas aestuarii]
MLATKLTGFVATYKPFNDPSIDADDFDLVVPLRLDAMRWLNSERGAALRKKALLPPNRVLDLCDDKLEFARFLIKHGYGDNVPSIEGPLEYPYILKRRSDEWGNHSHLIKDAEDESRHAAHMASGAYFCQTLITGHNEYATHMLVDGTTITHCSTVQIRFDADDVVFREGVKPLGFTRTGSADHIKLFAGILVRLGFEGLCCFDYKLAGGVVKIFELNPRFGGSLAFTPNGAIASYANIVAKRLRSDGDRSVQNTD